MKFLKIILLISAFLAVVLRLLAYENADFLGEKATFINITAFISAGVCIASALIWALILKKQEKEHQKDESEE